MFSLQPKISMLRCLTCFRKKCFSGTKTIFFLSTLCQIESFSLAKSRNKENIFYFSFFIKFCAIGLLHKHDTNHAHQWHIFEGSNKKLGAQIFFMYRWKCHRNFFTQKVQLGSSISVHTVWLDKVWSAE